MASRCGSDIRPVYFIRLRKFPDAGTRRGRPDPGRRSARSSPRWMRRSPRPKPATRRASVSSPGAAPGRATSASRTEARGEMTPRGAPGGRLAGRRGGCAQPPGGRRPGRPAPATSAGPPAGSARRGSPGHGAPAESRAVGAGKPGAADTSSHGAVRSGGRPARRGPETHASGRRGCDGGRRREALESRERSLSRPGPIALSDPRSTGFGMADRSAQGLAPARPMRQLGEAVGRVYEGSRRARRRGWARVCPPAVPVPATFPAALNFSGSHGCRCAATARCRRH